MSVTSIPEHVRYRLWGLAAGRCQYRGCNEPLWMDGLTQAEFNIAYVAHIVADSPNGPRGDPVRSKLLAAELSNLMLMCDKHHRLIDKAEVEQHPESLLRQMKVEHEDRVVRVGGITHNRRSELLIYNANIGAHSLIPSYADCASAILPERYPARDRATIFGLTNSRTRDSDPDFWSVEATQLRRSFNEDLKPILRHESTHLSVFALGPQPLLMLLGYLLGDLVPATIYQRHREPPTWNWLNKADTESIIPVPAKQTSGPPALVLALSGTIADDRVHRVLGANASIWKLTIPTPYNDYLATQQQLQDFRGKARTLLDQIKAAHGGRETLHVFPAAPVAVCVELGRLVMPKADMRLRIYDEIHALGGFVHALDLTEVDK